MRVAVVGLGLIGGSIALAARQRLGAEVSAWDLDPAVLSRATAAGVIDRAARSIDLAVADAEVAFVAAPPDTVAELVAVVLERAPAGCVVTDTGSTKRSVVAACSDARFVGGHPLAGAETPGVEHARADLFASATWYLTPSATSARGCVTRLRAVIAALGAEPVELAADTHDRLMAAVSQLPHVFADILVTVLADNADGAAVLGPSFTDATRVAGSNPAMWSAIYTDNRDELVRAIDGACGSLTALREALQSADLAAVSRWCERASQARQAVGR